MLLLLLLPHPPQQSFPSSLVIPISSRNAFSSSFVHQNKNRGLAFVFTIHTAPPPPLPPAPLPLPPPVSPLVLFARVPPLLVPLLRKVKLRRILSPHALSSKTSRTFWRSTELPARLRWPGGGASVPSYPPHEKLMLASDGEGLATDNDGLPPPRLGPAEGEADLDSRRCKPPSWYDRPPVLSVGEMSVGEAGGK